jgi:hypothetical protein
MPEPSLILTEQGLSIPRAFDASRGGSRSERQIRALTNALIAINEKAQERLTESHRIAAGMGEELEKAVKAIGQRDVFLALVVSNMPDGKITLLPSQLEHFAKSMSDRSMSLKMEIDPEDGTHRLTFERHEIHAVPNPEPEVDPIARAVHEVVTGSASA